MEVGNSGMFRPEMLRPMGLPEDVSVIAWGLSLERWACFFPSIAHLLLLHHHFPAAVALGWAVASAVSSEHLCEACHLQPA